MSSRECRECGKQFADIFYRSNVGNLCPTCCKAWHADYQKKNREKLARQHKEYHRRHRARLLKQKRAYAKKHRLHRRRKAKEWREKNIERARANDRKRYYENPDRRNNVKRWMEKYPERVRAHQNAHNAKVSSYRRGAPGMASAQAIRWRMEMWGEKCWICGGPFEEVDHVKPLAKGGSNWPANLRPACRPCNLRKRDLWPFPLKMAA